MIRADTVVAIPGKEEGGVGGGEKQVRELVNSSPF